MYRTTWTASLLVLLNCDFYVSTQKTLPPSCSSQIYCQGSLLHTVQTARIFRDSKTFVDLRLIKSENETLEDFARFIDEDPNPSRNSVEIFVNEHFVEGNELMNWTIPDHNPEPPLLSKIVDPKFRDFARTLIQIWPTLARKVSPEVSQNPELYSLISIPNGFIVPGGRFKEIYYWDSYWIIEGLLLSGMTQTARGMIENFMYLVKLFGHIPNGSRVYYSQRSQPPLLTGMAVKYLQTTDDTLWLQKYLPTLESEINFWIENRSIRVSRNNKKYTLLRYYAPSLGPRPESYYEDYAFGSEIKSEDRKQEFYTDLKSAAESGWDFSSRWFVDSNGTSSGNLSNIHTRRIITVDLNSIFASALETIGDFNSIVNGKVQALKWWKLAEDWRNAIDAVLWNDEDGIWYDYDLELERHRKYFYPTNLSPAWQKCVDEHKLKIYAPKIINYLKKSGGLDYPGGIPASITRTGEQWDFPNAWPPLQSVLVQGLENLNTTDSKKMAEDLAQRWVRANYKGFLKSKEMFEKYDAEKPGEFGGGGEYVVQSGFGWTNGVVLEFLNQYGSAIHSEDSDNNVTST